MKKRGKTNKMKINNKRWIAALVIGVMLVQSLFIISTDTRIYADSMSKEELALKAIELQYSAFTSGTVVDGTWGNFSPYDGYYLLKAGVDLDAWIYEDVSFADILRENIDLVLVNEESDSKATSKEIMQMFLIADRLEAETSKSALWQIIDSRNIAGSLDQDAYNLLWTYDLIAESGKIGEISTNSAINFLLEQRNTTTGAWLLGDYPGIMETSQAIRALSQLKAYSGSRSSEVQLAIDEGVAWLQTNQIENGGFSRPWSSTVTNTVEVINALKSEGLPIDVLSTGASIDAMDYMINNAFDNDTFGNVSETAWALDGYIAIGAVIEQDDLFYNKLEIEKENISEYERTQITVSAIAVDGTVLTNSALSIGDESILKYKEGILTGVADGNTTIEYSYGSSVISKAYTVNPLKNTIDKYALEAVKRMYTEYINEELGSITSYDVIPLIEYGVDPSKWIYNGKTLKSSIIDNMHVVIDKGNTDSKASIKAVMNNYKLATMISEDNIATSLMAIAIERQQEDGGFDVDEYSVYSNMPALDILRETNTFDNISTSKAIDYVLSVPTSSGFLVSTDKVKLLELFETVDPSRASEFQTIKNDTIDWLASKQVTNGGFTVIGPWGPDDYAIDTSYMVMALDAIGEEIVSLESATSLTAIDYLVNDAYTDGRFNDYNSIYNVSSYLKALKILGATVDTNEMLTFYVDETNVDIFNGHTKQLVATRWNVEGTTVDITGQVVWSSSDESKVTVDESGIVTAIKNGQAIVTGVYNGVTNTIQFSVTTEPGPEPTSYYVHIAIIGSDGELVYSPNKVKVSDAYEYKLSAMSALVKTGLSYTMVDNGYVKAIAGQGEDLNGTGSGWMFSVNGEAPGDTPRYIDVDSGDQIVFWYSGSDSEAAPTYTYALSLVPSTNDDTKEEEATKNINKYKEVLTEVKEESNILNKDKMMSESEATKLESILQRNNVKLEETVSKSETVLVDEKEEVILLIPDNALSENKKIVIDELKSDEEPKQFAVRVHSSTYEFGPSGTKFDEPVTMSIKIPVTEEMDIESLSPAWYDEEKKQWIPIPGVIDLKTGTVIFTIDHFTKFAVLEVPKRIVYEDVSESYNWAKEAIEILAGKDIIQGTGIGFEPSRSITRAEFIKLLIKSLEKELNSYNDNTFNDVSATDWYADYVATAYNEEIVMGDAGSFRPNDPISRNEIAVILSRIDKSQLESSQMPFIDQTSIPNWAQASVAYVYQEGLMNGYLDNTFGGEKQLSRAEAAIVIYKYLDREARE